MSGKKTLIAALIEKQKMAVYGNDLQFSQMFTENIEPKLIEQMFETLASELIKSVWFSGHKPTKDERVAGIKTAVIEPGDNPLDPYRDIGTLAAKLYADFTAEPAQALAWMVYRLTRAEDKAGAESVENRRLRDRLRKVAAIDPAGFRTKAKYQAAIAEACAGESDAYEDD